MFVSSSMLAYLSHYVFIVISANYIVRPLELEYIPALIVNLMFTCVCISLTICILGLKSNGKNAPNNRNAE